MFFFTSTAAILALLCIGFAAFIFRVKGRDVAARLLAYFSVAVAIWVGSNAMADLATTPSDLTFWSGMAFVGVAWFVSLHLCFVHAFLHGRLPSNARMAVMFFPAICFSMLAFGPLSVAATFFPPDAPAQILPGPLYWPIFVFLLAGLAFGAWQLSRRYADPKRPSETRKQILFMEIGFAIVFACSILFGIVLPFMGELRFYSIGPQSALVLIGCCGYAILRHNLLDIRSAAQKGVIYSLTLGLVIALYLAVLCLLSAWMAPNPYLAASIITTLIGISGAPRIIAFFRKITDPIFFKDRYRYADAMERLSHALNRHADLKGLLDDTLGTLRQILKAEHVDFVRLPAPPRAADVLDVPVALDCETIGTLRLGPKRSGDDYDLQDRSLLKSFSYQFAVAVEKARLYQEARLHSEQLEEKVRARTEELKYMHETQAQMMIDISHNLQTPLTILKGQLSALKSDGRAVDQLEKSVDMASDFIARLLKLATLSHAGDGEGHVVDFSALLEDIVSYFAVTAEMQGIRITSEIAKALRVRGQEKPLQDLVLNILSNAAKYIADPKHVHISLAPHGNALRLTVRDTGIGISAEALPTLFTRFRRGSGAPGGGTGLGLAICRKIVELHHGTIAVDSLPGTGTTVTVTLPLCASC